MSFSLKELEDAYTKASLGKGLPTLVMANIRGLGFVEATPKRTLVNGQLATPEQLKAIKRWSETKGE